MLTVACVWVAGHVPFTAQYVVRLQSMVARNLARSFRFVCLTDRPQLLPARIETIEIPPPGALKGWWRKLELFNPAHGLAGRVLYLDLDVLIVAGLDPIVAFPAPFALAPDGAPEFRPKSGHATVKRFNSSVMVWDADQVQANGSPLHADFVPAVADRLWGDQDWIGERWPAASRMPLEWFPRISEIGGAGDVPPEAKVVLVKKPKNELAAELWPWFRRRWR